MVDLLLLPGRLANGVASYPPRFRARGERRIASDGRLAKTNPQGFDLLDAEEFLSEPDEEIPWLWDGLFQPGAVSLVVSKPKTGKSFFSRCLALAVAEGHEFLGRATRQAPVIFFGLDEPKRNAREHFQKIGLSNQPLYFNFDAFPEAPAENLRLTIERYSPGLVVIDTLAKFLRFQDGNDYAETLHALEPLVQIARDTGAHIALVHHARKAASEDSGDVILGSTAIFSAVDCAVVLKKDALGHRFIESAGQRMGEELEPTFLRLDESGWISGDNPEQAQMDAALNAILTLLRESSEPLKRDEILRAVNMRRQKVLAALNALVENEEIERAGGGKRGDAFAYSLR